MFTGVADTFSGTCTAGETKEYRGLLDADGRGTMGAVRYPRLHISLPVRHGTDAATLEKSAGHLYGTSLPVGDESTHAVVAAHRGLADRLMFTNLGLAKKGDLFEIDVQGERLRYKVTDIRVNGPDDVKPLAVEKGRDLVTLYTCTPYGVNTRGSSSPASARMRLRAATPVRVERLPDWLVPLWGLLGVLVGGTVRGPKRRPGRHAKSHPYATDIFERFIQHILDQVANDSLSEESALETGYF